MLILKNNKQVLVKLKEKKIDDLFPLLFNLKLLWVLIICWLSDWLCGTRWSTLWSRKHGGHLPRSQRQGHVSFSYIHCKPMMPFDAPIYPTSEACSKLLKNADLVLKVYNLIVGINLEICCKCEIFAWRKFTPNTQKESIGFNIHQLADFLVDQLYDNCNYMYIYMIV